MEIRLDNNALARLLLYICVIEEVIMCPLKESCQFYNQAKNTRLSSKEMTLMKDVFCDSELFMLNKDCKIFYMLMQRKRPSARMMPVGEI